MSEPDRGLMSFYGTEDLYLAKLANKKPLAAALALPILAYMFMRSNANAGDQLSGRDYSDNVRFHAAQAALNAGDDAALRGDSFSTQAPQGYYDKSASIVADIGRDLAKLSGIGGAVLGTLSPGLKTKAILGAGALGAGYGALRAGRAVAHEAGKPAELRIQGAGPALPRYVNEWGVPS